MFVFVFVFEEERWKKDKEEGGKSAATSFARSGWSRGVTPRYVTLPVTSELSFRDPYPARVTYHLQPGSEQTRPTKGLLVNSQTALRSNWSIDRRPKRHQIQNMKSAMWGYLNIFTLDPSNGRQWEAFHYGCSKSELTKVFLLSPVGHHSNCTWLPASPVVTCHASSKPAIMPVTPFDLQ